MYGQTSASSAVMLIWLADINLEFPSSSLAPLSISLADSTFFDESLWVGDLTSDLADLGLIRWELVVEGDGLGLLLWPVIK